MAPNGTDGLGQPHPKLPERLGRYWPWWLIGAGLLAASVLFWPQFCFGDDCYRIEATQVTMVDGKLAGQFFLRSSNFNTEHSNGSGGACLFVHYSLINFHNSAYPALGPDQSSTNKDCGGALKPDGTQGNILKAPAFDTAFDGWESQCVNKSCWVRPGKGDDTSVCNKGHALDPNVANDFFGTIPPDPTIQPFDLATLQDARLQNGQLYWIGPKKGPIPVRLGVCLNRWNLPLGCSFGPESVVWLK